MRMSSVDLHIAYDFSLLFFPSHVANYYSPSQQRCFASKSSLHSTCLSVFLRKCMKELRLRGETYKWDKRQSAVSCGFLRFVRKSVGFSENLDFPKALFSGTRRESAEISENLRLGSVCPLGVCPLKRACAVLPRWRFPFH